MSKCKCWEYDSVYHGRCNGTKEIEPCSCNGNKVRCDFYESVRREGTEENNALNQNDACLKSDEVSAIEFLKEKKRMCQSYDDCHDCPIWEDTESCDDWICDKPEFAIPVIMKWASEHPRPITWNQWLHYLHEHYSGLGSNLSFMDWLNNPIPFTAKEKYNIPEVLNK